MTYNLNYLSSLYDDGDDDDGDEDEGKVKPLTFLQNKDETKFEAIKLTSATEKL